MKCCGKRVNALYVLAACFGTVITIVLGFNIFVSLKIEDCPFRIDIVASSTISNIPLWIGVIYFLYTQGFTVAHHKVATPLQFFIYVWTLLQSVVCTGLLLAIQFEKSGTCKREFGLPVYVICWVIVGCFLVLSIAIVVAIYPEAKHFIWDAPRFNALLLQRLKLADRHRGTRLGWETLTMIMRSELHWYIMDRRMQEYAIQQAARTYVLDEISAGMMELDLSRIANSHCQFCSESISTSRALGLVNGLREAKVAVDPNKPGALYHLDCAEKLAYSRHESEITDIVPNLQSGHQLVTKFQEKIAAGWKPDRERSVPGKVESVKRLGLSLHVLQPWLRENHPKKQTL